LTDPVSGQEARDVEETDPARDDRRRARGTRRPGGSKRDDRTEKRNVGAKVAVGSKLTATNVGAVIMETTKFGTLGCTSASLAAELTKNSGTAIEAKSVTPATNSFSTCTTSVGVALVFDEPTIVSLVTNSTTSDKGTLSLSDKATIGTGPVVCSYSGTGTFTYKTGTGNDILTISKAEPILLEGPEICRVNEGGELQKSKFSGAFTLEVDTGGTGTGPMDPVFVG
jgi:hypothetical protein